MSKPTLVFLCLLAVVHLGCNPFDSEGVVEVRVRNGSNLTFDEGVLYVHRDSLIFSALGPGQETPYQEVDQAYEIATTRVVTGTDTARLQVIDFVGEQPLGPGRYTYVLGFFEGNPTSLTLDLRTDR